MKEKDKETLEAEIKAKTSGEVSDTELDGVSGGLDFCAKRVCSNLDDKISLRKGTRMALDTSKTAMNSLNSSDSLDF